MGWVKGKAYWDELRAKGYNPGKAIESPDRMWELFLEYVADVDSNPAEKCEQARKPTMNEDGTVNMIVKFDLALPYTWVGFEAYLALNGVISSTLKEYKQNRRGNYGDYTQVIAQIDSIMASHNIAGASAGLLNPNIIARLQGLAEKREIAATLEDNIDYSKLDEATLEKIAQAKIEARTNDWNAKG